MPTALLMAYVIACAYITKRGKYMVVARLPVPNEDEGEWGALLNEFLRVEHKEDGALKIRTDGTLRRDHVNLLDYLPEGPDGVADNAPLIRRAIIDAGNEGPGRVFIPLQAKPWRIGSPVVIDEDIEIYSDSWGNVGSPCIQLIGNLNGYAFVFATNRATGNRVVFRNIEIDGNASSQTSGGIIAAYGPVECIFDTVHLHDAYDAALWLKGKQGVTPAGQGNRIKNSLFDNATNGRAVVVNTCKETIIDNCIFENNAGAVHLQDAVGGRIVGCTFDTMRRTAVHIIGNRVQVVGNSFLGGGGATANTYYHLHLSEGGYHAVSGNVFDSGASAQSLRGFIKQQSNCVHAVVTGNVFRVDALLGSAGHYDWSGSNATALNTLVKTNAGLADQV